MIQSISSVFTVMLQLKVSQLFCVDIKPFIRRRLWRDREKSFVRSNILYIFTASFFVYLYMYEILKSSTSVQSGVG